MKKTQSRNDILITQGIALSTSGAARLISDIINDVVVDLDPIRVTPIANWARANKSTCKIVFDLSVQGMSDLAIAQFFLQWAISALTAKIFLAGKTAEGVDVESREKLKAIVAP